jgi:hypothetical protein
MSTTETLVGVSFFVGAAVFCIGVGILGGVITYRALLRRGTTKWPSGFVALLVGLLVAFGGWIVLLPLLLTRRIWERLTRGQPPYVSTPPIK